MNLNEKIQKMDCWDIALIKFSCIFFGILLAVWFPSLVLINIWWLVTAVVILAIRPMYRVYFK